ncbi:hypothetical protein Taro_026229 [Colocasia esculenta]|uniref:Neprosin PEP catalytic domain-containing protein n=1 Tax=Colocasia esculenta TaxID=4460 RepID=A0A843VAX7_COLES|nr:hypothetical protein [Colocasia esculenta]
MANIIPEFSSQRSLPIKLYGVFGQLPSPLIIKGTGGGEENSSLRSTKKFRYGSSIFFPTSSRAEAKPCVCFLAAGHHGGRQNHQPVGRQHHMHLKEVVIKTFEIDNCSIDCIDIYQQPAFQHPLLVNHTLQHSLIQAVYDKMYGIKATLNVWNPKVEKHNEFSLSQVWLIGGERMNSLEAGWGVFPTTYGTTETRFFIYWTVILEYMVFNFLHHSKFLKLLTLLSLFLPDQYKTGCYNLRCPGFVQTNRHTILDSYLRPISVYGGPQYAIDVEIFKLITISVAFIG